MKISVIGLGKLGAPLAAVLASKGHTVVGVDNRPQPVEAVNQGKAPVDETGLESLIRESRKNLSATTDLRRAVLDTQVTFIVVSTPTIPGGGFSLQFVLATLGPLGAALKEKADYHLVVLTSTVMPGDIEARVRPVLEKFAGKPIGPTLGLCYNPEFIALGSVLHDMLFPDFILIGESDPRAGNLLAEIHRGVCGGRPDVARMGFANAEITKLAVNTFVTTKISYANTLARICQHIPGADVDVVTAALGLDTRIGPKYLKGAVSYGGPCFPRDNNAFALLGDRLGVPTPLAQATDATNRAQTELLAHLALANLPPGGSVGVLGLSYKPNTRVCTDSAGVLLSRRLREAGVAIIVFDPAALEEARRDLGETVEYADSASACARRADVLVVCVAWPGFAQLKADDLRRPSRRATVIDCWRMLNRAELEPVANLILLGVGPPTPGDGG
jgi:UDPglucose 6-dehydrogenase